MITVKTDYLVTRNAREKIQVVILNLLQDGVNFIIKRTTGQHFGKMTEQPEIFIEKGKVKRSISEQAFLEYNSKLKGYLDKGYKKLDDLTDIPFNELNSDEMDGIVPTLKVDQNGFSKVMLAKDFHKCQTSVLNKSMYCSRKLNGVRNSAIFNPNNITNDSLFREDNNINMVSRGGGLYNASTIHIQKELKIIFDKYPNLKLDGELYHHGYSLQVLSGLARLQTWEDRCSVLQYHIYDLEDGEMTFIDRLEILNKLKSEFKDLKTVFFLDHILTESWEQVQKLHDKFVAEGYEGVVCRKPDKVYGFGKRSSDMIKVKMYQEDSFRIIDWKEGLRGIEDMCFILETAEGKVFSAKPTGDMQLKEEYVKNMDDIIGLKGDVKFFDYSNERIPTQPIFLHVRYDL